VNKFIFYFTSLVVCSGCAVMHHTQIGEVDSSVVLDGKRFEIVVSEVGVSFREAGSIAKALARDQAAKSAVSTINNIISLFQMGPRTGNPVFADDYADEIFRLIREKCSGKISGLISVRESAKYPVVSGEIVKIIGYCQKS